MSVLAFPPPIPTHHWAHARYAAEAVAPGYFPRLLGAWVPVYGQTGDQWLDVSPYGAHGTFSAIDPNTDWVPSAHPGLPGNWVRFTSGLDFVSCGAGAHLANLFDGGATMLCVVTLTGWGDNFPAFCSKQNSSGTIGWACFGFNNAGEGQLRFRCAFSGNDGVWRSDNGALATGNTYVFAVQYNSSVTTAPTLWIGGVSQTMTTVGTPTGTRDVDSANALLMGVGNAGTFNDFVGDLGCLYFFRPWLSDAELLRLTMDPLLPVRKRPRLWVMPSGAAPAGRTTRNTRAAPLGLAHAIGWRIG